MLTWFEEQDIELEQVTIMDASRYQASLSERHTKEGIPVGIGTMHNYLKVARRFFGHLVRTDRMKTNPFTEIRYPRMGEHLSRNGLSEAQMALLLTELSRFDELPTRMARLRRYRTHVLAEFLYASGLRIAEACSLIESNLDLRARLVYLPEGKGGKGRTAFLTGYACEVMERYLSRGRELVFGKYPRQHGVTIFGANKARIAAVLNEELAAVCSALDLPVITSHGFRHSLGTHLLRSGCDMRHIQAILGHEALQTTQVYTRVDKDDLRRSLDAFHPRQWPRKRMPVEVSA
jgi:site-specific recombinase XerD